MIASMDQYLFLWVGFSLMSALGMSIVFAWAWKAGQFRDQGRARYLALWAQVPGDEPRTDDAADVADAGSARSPADSDTKER